LAWPGLTLAVARFVGVQIGVPLSSVKHIGTVV
jgi:hypothetical protein